MAKFSKYVGLDTHKDTIAVSVADACGGSARFFGEVANRPAAIKKLMKRLSGDGEVVSYVALVIHCDDQCNIGATYRRCSCTSISLYHVAIQCHRSLAECFEIGCCPKRPAYKALDFLRASALFAARRFSCRTRMG